MLIRCIDFEATGVPSDTERQALCEVGWCDLWGTAEFGWEHGLPTAVLTDPGRPMPPEAAAVHGIVDGDLVGAFQATRVFMEMNRTPPDYWCAYNADFEQNFFTGGEVPWLDPFKAVVRLFPDAPNHQQGTMRYLLGLDLDRDAAFPPHRAGPDAYVLAALLAQLLNDELIDVEKLARWTKGPALLPRCTVGEHRGKPWSEVDIGFLNWMLSPGKNFDRNVKATVKHELKRRSDASAVQPNN